MPQYIFPLVGLNNVGSTCFMNAILQCLLHISELSNYFLSEYPNDQQVLFQTNKNCLSMGQMSLAYYDVVSGVFKENKRQTNFATFSPSEFKFMSSNIFSIPILLSLSLLIS